MAQNNYRPKTPVETRERVIMYLRKQKVLRFLMLRLDHKLKVSRCEKLNVRRSRVSRKLNSLSNNRIAALCGVSAAIVSSIKTSVADLQRPL